MNGTWIACNTHAHTIHYHAHKSGCTSVQAEANTQMSRDYTDLSTDKIDIAGLGVSISLVLAPSRMPSCSGRLACGTTRFFGFMIMIMIQDQARAPSMQLH